MDDYLASLVARIDEQLPLRGDIHRRVSGIEIATGAQVIVHAVRGIRRLEVRGGDGELPQDFAIDQEAGVLVPQALDVESLEPEDRAALGVFALLDPRVLGTELRRARIFHTGPVTRVVGYVRLDHLPLRLPETYLRYLLEAGGPPRGWSDWAFDGFAGYQPEHLLDHAAALIFDRGSQRLLEVRQPDLYPRADDVIVERFSTP